ncbi:double zinc ribbon domain-containing protein [Candidatus Viridilinea mediisalina]|uniref:FHA domain-containing protein n=1 Tax=Candidatus Viridilinea mediisalina TaxID=2024553 RepID=A0A2A6RLK2_9CHLR|nr:zinc ribbon domain-containing protein [Candidatus Viridilinea mediisalina]PDW03805.1 hypothetical protein CJ255_07050 [Candidatus Viridilinea mediisalina]
MIACPTCGAQNDPGNRFCDQCGTRLQAQNPPPSPVAPADMPTAAAPLCPACGATVLPGEAFCDNCGADLSSALAPMPVASPPAVPTPTAPIASAANGTCWSCGAAVLPGERFCDNCGADLEAAPAAAPASPAPVDEHDAATIIAPPAAAPAPEPEPAPPAPVPEPAPPAPAPVDEHDAATIIAPPAAAPAPAPEPPAPAPAPEPAPPAPAPVDEHDAATIIAPPAAAPVPEPVPEPETPAPEPVAPPPPPVAMPEPEPPAPAPVAEAAPAPDPVAPPPPAPADAGPERSELEAEIARQEQIITQFEQMQATFGAATPPAVLSGLDEARQALAKAQSALAALPSTPAVDPAVIKALEEEVARQRQIITQFEQMQATFGAATPPAVLSGLDDAREALARAEGELNTLGVSVAPAPAAAPPATPAPPAAPAPAAAAPAPPPPAAPPAAGPRLIVVDGGHVINLPTNKSEIIVGREDPVSNIYPEVDLTSYGGEAGGVSRQHARILHNEGTWMLCDLNSTNYSRIDGVRLEPNQPKPLHDGARVQFGRVALTFHL